MRILHTADWHLGRQFEGHSLDQDQTTVLDQVFAAVLKVEPDALVVAGDIFDRAAPPESAVRLLNRFIESVIASTSCAIILNAGNHDSADRIGAMAMLSDRRRTLVRGPLSLIEEPLVLHDAHGPVAFSALPFGYEYAARECFADTNIKCPADVMRAQIAAARPHIPPGARWIIVAHAFVTGASISETERPLTRIAGGIETVPAELFSGAHYVALGHIHRPQTAGAPNIRYSGAPLAFGFDEEGNEKSMAVVDIDATGNAIVELIPFRPLRSVRTIRGTLEDLLKLPPSEDFIKAILTDEGRLMDPMKRIRERFPFACGLTYARDLVARQTTGTHSTTTALDEPETVVSHFMQVMRGTPLSDTEANIVADTIAQLASRENAPA
ncbi:MAG: exonuclease SbcCD subunit D [Burkholderiales bacterium]